MEEKIVKILNEMSEYLSITQMKKLQEVILKVCAEDEADKMEISNTDFLKMFLDAKKIEGCSERTIQYYEVTVEHLLSHIETSVRKITTEEIRTYLAEYQKNNKCSNVTVDNIRRNISSFFSWLEEEDYILKSPMKRIHKIKTKTVVKSIITDEGIERLRDNCKEIRDLAIIDLLYSTGIRVGELVNLNVDDIDLEGRECIVYGKGDKERRVYFDAKAKVHLKKYIDHRKDNNSALFVTLDAPHEIIQYKLLPDDVLMTEGGDPDKLGRGAIISLPPKDCIHQNHIFRVRLDETRILPRYFSAYLQSPQAKTYFLRAAKQTTGIASINMRQLRGLPTIVPPIEQQLKYVSFSEQVDKSKVINQLLQKWNYMCHVTIEKVK